MSSLLQFTGTIDRRGVHLHFVKVLPRVDGEYIDRDDPAQCYRCATCGRVHARIFIAVRKPVGMFGCWVVFRYLGAEHVPDLSIPISVTQLPRGARALSNAQSSEVWHGR